MHPQATNSGQNTVWTAVEQAATGPSEALPSACEILIVGAGITGLTAALRLQSAGLSVVIVDGASPASGTTGRSSAHLTTLLDSGLARTESIFSAADNQLALGAMAAAINRIEAWTQEHGIDCGFKRLDGYYFSEDEAGCERLRANVAAARNAGQEVEQVAAPPLPFAIREAYRFANQGAFDPVAYASGLARAFRAAGGRLFTGTRALDIHDGRTCSVDTPRGTIESQRLIVATHTPLGRSLVHAELKPQRSYIIAAELEDEPPDCLLWDTAQPYHYLRRVDRGPGRPPVLLLGGADHPTGILRSGADPYGELEAWMRERFRVRRLVDRWSAQFYETIDGFPYVGKPLTGHHLYVATGYAGDGLTLGTACGSIVADLVQGNESELSALFSPTRLKMKAAAEFASLNVKVVKHMAATGEDATPEPGEGAVRKDGGATAVYCAPDGETFSLSARCPHMGCIVQWNTIEKTWDCPCHGGRFSPRGERLEGPPRADMSPHEESAHERGATATIHTTNR